MIMVNFCERLRLPARVVVDSMRLRRLVLATRAPAVSEVDSIVSEAAVVAVAPNVDLDSSPVASSVITSFIMACNVCEKYLRVETRSAPVFATGNEQFTMLL